MNGWFCLGMLVAALVAVVPGTADDAKPESTDQALKVGDKAPDFKLMGTDGKEYTLKQFKNNSAVVIAWYPKALTGG
jgi:peroxiredoxin